MIIPLQQQLERAERKLRHLETYRANLRANHGSPYPAGLDERIERAGRLVEELRQAIERTKL